MRNVRLTVEYDGTSYSGWQTQAGVATVQGELEKALSHVCGHPAVLMAAGRTDAGVHALGQACNFKTSSRLTEPEIARIANLHLPPDIRIVSAVRVADAFHATYHAHSKIYRYVLRTAREKDVFGRFWHHPVRGQLDLSAMRRAAAQLKGTHDFTSFQGPTNWDRDPVRTLYSVKVLRRGPEVHLEFHGKSFLYQMVRILAGTLLYAGLGKICPSEIPGLLAGKDRRRAGPTLPPGGLFLVKVFYPERVRRPRKKASAGDGIE